MPIYLNGKTYTDISIGSKIKADLPSLTNPAGSDQILEGYQAINESGNIVNGNIVSMYNDQYNFDGIASISLDNSNNRLKWNEDIPGDYYAFTNTTIFTLEYSEIASTAGLTADKIVSGNTILGVAGTHTCSGGNITNISLTDLNYCTATDGVFTIVLPSALNETNLIALVGSSIDADQNEIVVFAYRVEGEWQANYFDSLSEAPIIKSDIFSISNQTVIWNMITSSAAASVNYLYSGTGSMKFYALGVA